MDTIFALASAPGRSGVAVIRISGPDALEVGRQIAGPLPNKGQVALRIFRGPDGQQIDQGLILVFHAPNSFTGEDVIEFQTHGSVAIVKALSDVIRQTGLVRDAAAGEFTCRALLENRLNLTQVEGLGALLEAETEMQRSLAMSVFTGRLGETVETWRKDLLRITVLLEAKIDFADEAVPEDTSPEVISLVTRVCNSLAKEIAGSYVAERVRDGFEVAIIGAPNSGKSMLLNFLAGRDAAITSEIAGTTRDIIEVRMDIGGLAVTFLDTAGLRVAEDQIEQLGIDRTRERAAAADLRLFLQQSDDETAPIKLVDGDIRRIGKGDLAENPSKLHISGKTGLGVAVLVEEIRKILLDRAARAATATHARHRTAMIAAKSALALAEKEICAGPERAEFAADHLRVALRNLDALVGRIDVEVVLGEIFSNFCIGK
ncbi:MAG: tRNA uridine-5-carboxymethylaminomethyl(34) synthesis GTPase MnmE [Rhodobacteraceae bacterium]|nr:tRNA uridine-5-carboxymethylaminomethyl(34) synthesis GTPase MnmE [Paracoccaceae bacterium]